MTFTITKKFMVRLENIEGFPNLDIVYESDGDNCLEIARKLKKTFGGKTKIDSISRQIYNSGMSPMYSWETIEGTSNL